MKPLTTILAAILGLSVLVSTPVSADVTSCGELHDEWREYKKDDQDPSRVWYLTGRYQGYIAGWTERDEDFEFPKGGTAGQMAAVVGKWLEDHPEKWHEHRVYCTYMALAEAYGLKD